MKADKNSKQAEKELLCIMLNRKKEGRREGGREEGGGKGRERQGEGSNPGAKVYGL